MAGSINKVILVGNVGKDPEIRNTQGGKKIATFSLATSESWKDKQSGDKKEKTEWHNVVVFNENLADVVDKYVNKGDKLYIEGSLQTRKWQDKEQNDRWTTEVVLQGFNATLVMLSGKKDGERGESRDDRRFEDAPARNPKAADSAQKNFAKELDDEIPF